MTTRSTFAARTSWILVAFAAVGAAQARSAEPLRLHPDNPHYLLFRGRPTVLVTSAEHYGAVLNLDFDYVPYLDELASHGLNLTRTFSGAYCEGPGSFTIKGNTLAPAPGRLICPWARSTEPGYARGGNRFDLSRWDDAYFRRLKDFVGEAGQRGIVVEVVLFCPFYEDEMWELCPLRAANNVNGIGDLSRTEVYTLADGRLTEVQIAMVQKIVAELAEFDNVYYEICNEPYFGGVTLDWQARIADVIAAAEANLPARHLIAQNIANGSQKISDPHPAVSIFNFHYAVPPDTVGLNFALKKVLADDETGFRGGEDLAYRSEGWHFLLAGGAVYSNLDYSFTPEQETGLATPDAPGGGGLELRKQLAILKQFMEQLDFVKMAPDDCVIRSGVPEGATARALVNAGKEYAIYIQGGTRADLELDLPAGKYLAEWINTMTGTVDRRQEIDDAGDALTLTSPDYREDIALRIRAR